MRALLWAINPNSLVDLSLDQGMTDKQFPGLFRINLSVGHGSAARKDKAEQRDLFGCHHLPAFFFPSGDRYRFGCKGFGRSLRSRPGQYYPRIGQKGWLVLTYSAATIQLPALLNRPEPGKMKACLPLAAEKRFFFLFLGNAGPDTRGEGPCG